MFPVQVAAGIDMVVIPARRWAWEQCIAPGKLRWGSSAKNVATGRSTQAQANPEGIYNVPNLMPGDYEVSTSGDGFAPRLSSDLAAGATQTLDFALAASSGLRRLLWGIWASPRIRPKEAPRTKRDSTGVLTCSRCISGTV